MGGRLNSFPQKEISNHMDAACEKEHTLTTLD
jgi:hypothetical protein